MHSIFLVGNIAAITLLLAMGAQLITQKSTLARLFAVMFVLLSVYLSLTIADYQAIHPALSFTVARLSSLIPAVIWLIAFHLFRDDEKIPLLIWPIIVGYVSLRAIGVALLNLEILPNSPGFYYTFIVTPQVVMIALAAHAIFMAVAGFRADLVENRRKFRVTFVVGVSVFILLTRIKTWIVYNGVVEGISSEDITVPLLDNLIMIYALALAMVFFMSAFKTNGTINGLLEKITPNLTLADFKRKKLSDSDQQLVKKIRQKMEVEQQFNELGLTVVQFAKTLGVHPHKLRRVITTYFNFSNFNQFLNYFRIKEAAHKLASTTEPISTIAYDVGFSSISAFNSAFKAIYGVTPSGYRVNAGGGRREESNLSL
ncbi:MAG: helix-turn-helix transcriptional regulator [Pseudomonadota bacterium]